MKKFFSNNSRFEIRNSKFSIPYFSCFLLLLPVAFFSSCVRNIYAPSVVYAPQLRDKYEGEFGINENGNSGLQMQTSFALTNFLGVQAQANAVRMNSGNFLAGPNCWWKHKMDDRDVFLIGFSAGYSCGNYKRYVARETGSGL